MIALETEIKLIRNKYKKWRSKSAPHFLGTPPAMERCELSPLNNELSHYLI